jgi:hypothetical protein
MSRLRLAKINAPSAPPATTAELFYSLPDAKLEAIDENGKITVLGGFASSDYRLVRVFWVIVNGTYGVGQAIAMTSGLRALYVEAVGGGGAGGGAAATSSNASTGGGGGGGAYAASWLTTASAGWASTYAIVIGLGGTAGAAGAAGNPGGNTTFAATVIVANGGSGGAAGSAAGTTGSTSRALGGAGGTGDVAINGGDGAGGLVLSASLVVGGCGGASLWGGNCAIFPVSGASATSTGVPAKNYGGGGGGGVNTGTQAATVGQVGGQGAIRIWEFA